MNINININENNQPMNEIVLQERATIKGSGVHTGRNAKPVICLTDGMVYASCTDAADAVGTSQTNMSACLVGRTNTCAGKRWCYIKDLPVHLEEFSENMKENKRKVDIYNQYHNKAVAKAKAEELRAALEKEKAEMEHEYLRMVREHDEYVERTIKKLKELDAVVYGNGNDLDMFA